MGRSRLKTFLGILAMIIFVILVSSIIYGLVRTISGSSETLSEITDTSEENLADGSNLDIEQDANTGEVSLFSRGPIISREEHYEVEIAIDKNSRKLNVYKGYLEQPIESVVLPNDIEAFKEFLYAAERTGLFIENPAEVNKDGYCYRGEVRTYTATGFGVEIDNWSNSCDGNGNLSEDGRLLKLIKEQFPDYQQYTEDIR